MATMNLGSLSSIASDLYIARVALAITVTALVYDFILTFDEEKDLIWPTRLSFVKLLFLLNRYSPFVAISGMTYVVISFNIPNDEKLCRPLFWIFGGVVIAEYLIAEVILYTRAYAICGRTKSSLFLLGISGLTAWACGGLFAVRFLKTAEVINLRFFPTGCVISLNGHIDMLAFISLVVSETIALFALLVKAIQIPNSMTLRRISADGIVFYIIILGASTANLIVLNVAPSAVCNFMIAPQAALHSICCNRLLLRIRKTVARSDELANTSPPSRQPYLSSTIVNAYSIEMNSFQPT